MTSALLLSLLAGLAAAEHLVFPLLSDEELKLLNPDDQGYKLCAAAESYLNGCIALAGGQSALATANPSSLAACACCVGTTDIGPAFSTCSSYLSQEAPLMSTQISAYGQLYSICNGNPQICSGGSVPAKTTPPSSTAPTATSYVLTDGPSSTSTSNSIVITSAPTTSISWAQACSNLVGLFTSCEFNTPGFSKMPYKDQASCYCCQTSQGRLVYTDQLDQYAASCRDWAKTGEPLTAYPLASTFASFCSEFSNACDAQTTAKGAQSSAANAGITTTPTQQTAAAADTSQPSAAMSNFRASHAAVLAAIAVFLLL